MNRHSFLSWILSMSAMAAAPALAQLPTAVLQDSGNADNSFADGAARRIRFSSFDRPVKSGTGSRWILLARNTAVASADAMYITGAGLGYNLVALEGTTAFEPGRTFETSDRYVDINESGDWVGIGNLVGGATTDDEVVYAGNFTGSSLRIAAREGQFDPTGDGGVLGTANYGPGITDGGAVSFGYSFGTSTTAIGYYTADGMKLVLRDGSSVTGSGMPFSTAGFGGRNAFQVTSDGSSYVVIGTLGSSSGPTVLIKDSAIVLAEGGMVTGRTIEQILGEQNILQDDGSWLTRVRFTDGTGGAIKNGALLAASGDLVGGTVAGERWSEVPWTATSDSTFALVTGDSRGNVVLGGFTDNTAAAPVARNFVWTYNGVEFLRTGDAIDLDGNGTLDDAIIYTSSFSSASPDQLGGFLTDDGYLYATVDWRSADGTITGDALIRVAVPRPSAERCDSNCDGATNFDDIDCFVSALVSEIAWDACGHGPDCDYVTVNDANGDSVVNFDDIDAFVTCLVGG